MIHLNLIGRNEGPVHTVPNDVDQGIESGHLLSMRMLPPSNPTNGYAKFLGQDVVVLPGQPRIRIQIWENPRRPNHRVKKLWKYLVLKSRKNLLLSALAYCLIASFGESQASTNESIEIRFSAQVNGEPFDCGKSYAGVGASGKTVTPSDFRLFISEISVLTKSGKLVPVKLHQDKLWQFDDVVLLDFENGKGPCGNGTSPMNMSVRGSVPRDTYVGIRFTIGVPQTHNHSDPTTAPAPLSTTAMFWNWQGGYKFIKFDSSAQAEPQHSGNKGGHQHEASAGFSFHLGSTQCAALGTTPQEARCRQPNRVAVELTGADPRKKKVVVDIGRVLENTDVSFNTPNSPPGCMSSLDDPDCREILQSLSLLPAPGRETRSQRLVSW